MKHYVEHLSRELFRYALTVTVLLFLLFTVGLIINLQSSTVEVLRDGATRLAGYWGESIEEIEGGIVRLAESDVVVALAGGDASVAEQADAFSLLYEEANGWSSGSSFTVADSSGDVVASSLYRGNQEVLADSALLGSLRAAIRASDDGSARQALRAQLSPPHSGTYATAVAVLGADGTWHGAMLVGILGESGLIDQVRAQSIERIVVTDFFDNIFLDTGVSGFEGRNQRLGSKFIHTTPNFLTLTANGVDYFHAGAVDATTGVNITVLAPQRFFWRFASTSFLILGVVAVLMVALARVLTVRQSRRSAQALASLDHGIDEWFMGNMDFRLESPTYEEFAGIYDSFNRLVAQLDAQVKSNIALEQSHTALEIRQLETQFNPHFVFNTLEMLRYEIPADPDVAGRIVLDLAGLMRYSIRERGNAVRLSEDVAYLRSFLELHKLRLDASMDYEFDCTPDALDALIPRLLIQPLVENALAHAVAPEGVPLQVVVEARVVGDVLTICVRDNGAPIAAAMLDDIRGTLAAEEQPAQHLGVFLVNRVVTLMYGRDEGHGLQIESDSRGTRAFVRIPYEV